MNVKAKLCLQLVGVISVCVGTFLVATWLGLVVTGLLLTAIATGQPEKLPEQVLEKEDDG